MQTFMSTLLNARSVCNKLIDFQDLLIMEHLDIVAVNETWINNSIPDAIIVDGISKYSIYRKGSSNSWCS